jgi:23S rRNA pseudouridine1911/1915/1917 synthase
MPSKNMLPKGKRRHSVREDYRKARTAANDSAEVERLRREAEEFSGITVAGTVEAASEDAAQAADGMLETADFMDEEPTLEERIANNNWITTRGASGSKVAEETHAPPRYANRYARLEAEEQARAKVLALASVQPIEETDEEDERGVRQMQVNAEAAGVRLDAFLARALPDISRARVQALIDGGSVTVNGASAKSGLKLRGGEALVVSGALERPPLDATPEDIPLDVVYEDADLLVVNKPAGMMVHAGAGSAEHNRGTLVNALLGRMQGAGSERQTSATKAAESAALGSATTSLSAVAGEMRPGIVHRLDKDTSGLIVVAKHDSAHRKLSEMFASRSVHKSYLALVHGWLPKDEGTVRLPIARDAVRRIRMTTKDPDGRAAVSHWRVLRRLDTPWGKFSLVAVRIETGRTHQIRVHMAALGHPVAGDALYGAPARLRRRDDGALRPNEAGGVEEKAVAKEEGAKKLAAKKAAAKKAAAEKAAARKAVATKAHAKHALSADSAVDADADSAEDMTAASAADANADEPADDNEITLDRNFLHAAELSFEQPLTKKRVELATPLPAALQRLLARLEAEAR